MPTLPATAPPTAPRIVKCPKCRSILQEPPPGNPFYQCGNCSTTLQAKHATQRELEAANRRISVEQRRRDSSYSDSSSGEIGSDAGVDEYALTPNGNDSPLFKEMILEDGMRGRDVWGGVTKPQQQHPYPDPAQDAGMVLSDSFLRSLRNQEQELKQRALDASSGGDYISSQVPQGHEIASSREQQWSRSPDQHASYGMPVVQVQQRTEGRSLTTAVSSSFEFMTMPSVGAQIYGTETTPTLAESRTATNGNDFITSDVHQQQLLQGPHVQHRSDPDSLDSVQDDAHNHNHHHDLGALLSSHEASGDDSLSSQPQIAVGSNNSSGQSRRKLRWKVRESDSGEDATSSGADDDGSSQDDGTCTVSVKESTSLEGAVQPVWRRVQSNRRSFGETGQVTAAGAAGQPQLVRTPSEDSDRPLDMYENSWPNVLDYEPSDSSSTTTMDEVEMSAGGAGSGSGEMDPYHPRAIIGQGIPQPVSRRNFPRSSSSLSNRGALSEESSSYGSPRETSSPDNHMDTAKMINVAARRHSWDDRLSSMGTVGAPGHTGPLGGSPLSVRQKSSSQDYGSGQQADYLHRVSSDPSGTGYSNARGRPLPTPTSSYDNYSRQTNPLAGLPSLGPQQQPWANRYVPPSESIHQPWSPNSASHHRPYVPEQSSLHPFHSRLSSSVRGQIQSGQLPPKQGHYPPLPPPGALQQVLCQHCGLLLAVPENLPANPKNTQKLRCGSCRKISIFSVSRAEGSNAAQVLTSSPSSHSLQNNSAGLLVSSPDSQSEFTSAFRPVSDSLGAAEKQRTMRRYSVSDLADRKQQVQQAPVQAPLVRKHSLGNEDVKEIDQEILERIENLSMNASASQSQDAIFTSSETDSPSSPFPRYKNNISINVNVGYRDPLSEQKPSSEGILSDSDSESMLRSLSAAGSPQLNHINSWSPPPIHSPQQDPMTSGRASGDATHGQVHELSRGLNRTLNRIFIFRKSKQAGAGHYRRKVVVNGVPIPDHLVKKADEQAGPVHPGTYWYDSQAGFWGVAGGPCLGIIPPFIEEFNYPMTRDCAAGRTGIFVNGRELHHADREKLCRRGLPDTPGMSYLIEIDGRVIEEATGSELRSLGRLAPSLEKTGRGSGMQVPSNISGRS